MISAIPALAVALSLLVLWPPATSAFHDPKRLVLVVAAAAGALLTLPRWRWTALPLVTLCAVLPWRVPDAGLQALAFAWALAAWPALKPNLAQVRRLVGPAAAIAGSVVLLQWAGLDPLAALGPDAAGTRLRLYGTLGNPDFVASALVPLGVLLLAEDRSKTSWLMLAPIFGAVLVTRSFGSLLSVVVAGALLLARAPRPRPSTPLGVNGLRFLVIALLVLGLSLLGRSPTRALEGRAYLVSVAAPHVNDAPLLGLGAGATVLEWPAWELTHWQARCADAACVAAHPDARFTGLQDHVHADWLEWLLERGVLGLLALGLALAGPLRAAWRRTDVKGRFVLAALGAALARGVVDFPFERPADLAVIALLAALA